MAKVLYIEDDAVLAESVKSWLEINSNLVEIVSNAEDALHLLLHFDYEIVLLDWDLPGISGLDFCNKYRRGGGKAWIIFVTGKNDASDLELALQSGGDAYIRKPFSPRELSAQISALLRRVDRLYQAELKVRDFSLNRKTNTLVVGNSSIHLMPKECDLLDFLLRNSGQGFSAKELLSSVWASDKGVTDGVVRTYIRQIRKKLEEIGRDDLIETATGLGYIVRQK